MFALQQDEVAAAEIGPDFIAFDTEFIRHPEQGNRGYPSAYADRFRATVPFSQLYQICRKVFTPTEQEADEVSYSQEIIIYYNAAVYKNYPTPADINQAYAAALR